MRTYEFYDIIKKELDESISVTMAETYRKFKTLGISDWEIKRHLKDLALIRKIKIVNWNISLDSTEG